MAHERELSIAEVQQARIAGLPTSRPGYGAAYPRMLYRLGRNPDHYLLGEPLKIAGIAEAETLIVADEVEEQVALSEGWSTTVPGEKPKRAA